MFVTGELDRNLSEVVTIQIPERKTEREREREREEEKSRTKREKKGKLLKHVGNFSSPAV